MGEGAGTGTSMGTVESGGKSEGEGLSKSEAEQGFNVPRAEEADVTAGIGGVAAALSDRPVFTIGQPHNVQRVTRAQQAKCSFVVLRNYLGIVICP